MWLYQYARPVEAEVFRQRGADYLVFLSFVGALALGFSLLAVGGSSTYPAGALLMSHMYVWSRSYPDQQVSLYGMLRFRAFYLPFVMAGVAAVFSGQVPWDDIAGIGAAHAYWLLAVLLPARRGAPSLLPTPHIAHVVAERLGMAAPRVTVDPAHTAFRGRARRLNE